MLCLNNDSMNETKWNNHFFLQQNRICFQQNKREWTNQAFNSNFKKKQRKTNYVKYLFCLFDSASVNRFWFFRYFDFSVSDYKWMISLCDCYAFFCNRYCYRVIVGLFSIHLIQSLHNFTWNKTSNTLYIYYSMV